MKNIYTIVSTTACNVSSIAKDMDLDTFTDNTIDKFQKCYNSAHAGPFLMYQITGKIPAC